MASRNENTFLRLAAFSYKWCRGSLAKAKTEFLAGLLIDLFTQGAWEALRMLVPADSSPADLIPYLMRNYGLPQYETALSYSADYFAAMARVQDMLRTHSIQGSREQLADEADSAGLSADGIDKDDDACSFWFTSADAGATHTLGDAGLLLDGSWNLGPQIDARLNRNVYKAAAFFKPARSKFEGVKAP